MAHKHGWDSHNLRVALRQSALDRQCKACGRKAAMRRVGLVINRTLTEECRWCKAVKVYRL